MLTGTPVNGKSNKNFSAKISLQKKIETIFTNLVQSGFFETIAIYNEDGLPIVANQFSSLGDNPESVEISLFMATVRKNMDRISDVGEINEIIVAGTNGKRVIFRFILFYGQEATIVATVPAGHYYRNITNKLQKTITQLCEMEA